MMSQIALIIFHRTKAGKRADVQAIWDKHMAPAIQANLDHLAYFYCFDLEDEDVIRVFQLYADKAASESFLTHPNYLAYLSDVEELLLGPPEIFSAEPQWQKAV